MATKKSRDTYWFARKLDLENYSLLVACGGDGTYHEVVNGMLAREDNYKLPIGVIPNGSGNDTCRSLGVNSVNDALDLIVHAEVLAMDTIRVLIDIENFEDIKLDEFDALDKCRYMVNDLCLAMTARISYEGAKYKGCFGTNCYAVATI